jgi:WD40 repeat protein
MFNDEGAAREAPTELSPRTQRRARRRWPVPFGSAVALLAVLAMVVAACDPFPQALGKSTATTLDSPLALDPAALGMTCVNGAEWSPDSAKIAILGTLQGCSQSNPNNYYPNVVAIVNATNGHLLESLQPDSTVLSFFHLHAPQGGAPITGPDSPGAAGDLFQPGVAYDGLAWSPDGKSVAMPFSFAYTGASPSGGSHALGRVSVSGLYIGAIDGSSARAIGETLSQQLLYVAEWNVKTGKPVVASASLGSPIQGGTVAQLEPPSLSYSWRSDGSLSGSGALNTSRPPAPAPLDPVGNPDGGASFTVWQPMSIQVNVGDPANPQPTAAFSAWSGFVAWSPDGTYVLATSYVWRVQPSKQPIPSETQLQREGSADLPLLPIRDAAMDAMLSPEQGDHPHAFASAQFTWSPDGKMLAAIADGGATMISPDLTVLIADCASGKTLTTLQVGSASTASGNISDIQWSPDGKKLLVGAESEYFVFGADKLPQE